MTLGARHGGGHRLGQPVDHTIAAALQRPFAAPPPPAAPEPVRLAAPLAAPVVEAGAFADDAAAGGSATATDDAATEDAAAPAPELPVYRPASLASRDADAFFTPRGLQALERQIRDVLDAEAPIVFDLLVRRIVDAWGLGRVTERVRDRVGTALPGDVVRGDHGALWPAGADPFAFTAFRVPDAGDDATMREADQLPAIEVANAMRWLLDQHGSLAESDLLREAARLFGWSRLGSAVRTGMQQGLDVLVARGKARIDAGVVLPG